MNRVYLEGGTYGEYGLTVSRRDEGFSSTITVKRDDGPLEAYVATDRVDEYGVNIYVFKEGSDDS